MSDYLQKKLCYHEEPESQAKHIDLQDLSMIGKDLILIMRVIQRGEEKFLGDAEGVHQRLSNSRL